MKLFSLVTLLWLLSPLALAAPNPACNQISQLLFSSQMQQNEMSEEQFKIIDQNLKASFLALCESGSSSDYVQGNVLYYPNGQIATTNINDVNEAWYYPDGTPVPFGQGEMQEFLDSVLRGKSAKISSPFEAKHKVCASGCGYVSWGIWGDAAHKKRKSCHNSGDAIDIHAITCGGKTYAPPTKRFLQYVSCMDKYFGTIHGNKDHKKHVHIELKNCRKVKG